MNCVFAPHGPLPCDEMEKLKTVVNQIAYTQHFSKLSLLQRSVIPLLSLASSVYNLSLSARFHLYRLGFLRTDRLPVPVISVGNLTWGGNGKTPMVEFLALWFATSSISPLILSRGYAGGDEVRMLQRHFLGTSAKIGVGANRAKVASSFLQKYDYTDPSMMSCFEKQSFGEEVGRSSDSHKVGLVILDDGMQHLSLMRDVEIMMVNGLMQWGNHQLLPLGPLREPLTALERADVVVIHHADLISDHDRASMKLKIRAIKESIPIYFTRMVPSHFFMANDIHCKVPLSVARDKVILCISAIGSPDAFLKGIEKLGPVHIDRIDFCDHHSFLAKIMEGRTTIGSSGDVNSKHKAMNKNSQKEVATKLKQLEANKRVRMMNMTRLQATSPTTAPAPLPTAPAVPFAANSGGLNQQMAWQDIMKIKSTIKMLEHTFTSKVVIIVTEKDYDRDPEILLQLLPDVVHVLCSRLQFAPLDGSSEESFKRLLKQLLKIR